LTLNVVRETGEHMTLCIETPEPPRLVEQLSRLPSASAETTVAVTLRERLAQIQLTAAEAERRARVYTLVTAPQARFQESP